MVQKNFKTLYSATNKHLNASAAQFQTSSEDVPPGQSLPSIPFNSLITRALSPFEPPSSCTEEPLSVAYLCSPQKVYEML